MGFTALRFWEYSMVCDVCGVEEVLHTNDNADDIYVHNKATAIKAARYHQCKEQLLCDECFEKRRKKLL